MFADPHPGRVQHIRVAHSSWSVDILNIYQKTYNSHPKASSDSKAVRATIWQCIADHVQRVPQRSTLALMGDFNCPLMPGSNVGPRADVGSGTHPPDQLQLQHIMERYALLTLLHLNSWSRQTGATYVHQKGESLIDHLLMRTAQADNRAKQARRVNLGLAEWRQGGKHLPVMASIPIQFFCKLNGRKPAARQWNHWEVVRLCKDESDPRCQQLRELCRARLPQATDIASLNQLLIQCAMEVFPSPPGSQRLALWQTPNMQGGIKAMWAAYHEWKTPARTAPTSLLAISRAYHTFKQAHKDFRKAGKASRKQWFQGRLKDLQSAATSGDTRTLYRHIRTLAPKQVKTKVQLRDPHGRLQDEATQIKQLETHYRKLYAADEPSEKAGPPRTTICLHLQEARRPNLQKPWHPCLHTKPRLQVWPPTPSGGW